MPPAVIEYGSVPMAFAALLIYVREATPGLGLAIFVGAGRDTECD